MMKKLIVLPFLLGKALFAGNLFFETENIGNAVFEAKNYDEFFKICGDWHGINDSEVFGIDIERAKTNHPKIDEQLNERIPTREELIKRLEKSFDEAIIEVKKELLNKPKSEIDLTIYCGQAEIITPAYIGHYQNLEQFLVSHYIYLGGAHGMYSTEYFIFNDQDKRLTLQDMIQKGKEEELKQLLLAQYQKEFEKSQLDEEEKKEILKNLETQNIYFSPNGLNFSYPPYALAGFAQGEVILTLSYEQLKNILLPEYQSF